MSWCVCVNASDNVTVHSHLTYICIHNFLFPSSAVMLVAGKQANYMYGFFSMNAQN